uniref:Uncharacterized protein n=1 Tax=Capra hircus TaxID=9925 RepID=A0A8C2NV04_CAPHI
MSSRESPAVEFSTTTVSSVAVQAGDSKIVIAVIKCGKWVQLQLAESQPNLLEIGSNQDETKKLLHDHELLLAKLKPTETANPRMQHSILKHGFQTHFRHLLNACYIPGTVLRASMDYFGQSS